MSNGREMGAHDSRAAPHGFGIIGAGAIASTHAQAIASVPGARLVAVADVVPERAAALAAETGCVTEHDVASLLARDDLDVVTVCVPSGLHAQVGMQAAAARKHLVIEKPIDVTLSAADQVIAAAKAAGVMMTVIFQSRFAPGLVELRRLLDEGALGTLLLGETSTKWYRNQAYYDSSAWRGTWSLDGGSLMNQGIHYVDLLRWFMGPVAEVTALCATQTHQMEAEDVALAMLRFKSGALGTIATSTSVFPGFAQRLEITGTRGTVVVEDGEIVKGGFISEASSPDTGRAQSAATVGAAANAAAIGVSGHAAQIADFMAAIDEGREPAVTARSARDTLEIACAVYESAREGRTVRLSDAALSDVATAT